MNVQAGGAPAGGVPPQNANPPPQQPPQPLLPQQPNLGAPPGGAGGGGAPPALPPRPSYHSQYADRSNDRYDDQYATVFGRLEVPGAGMTPAQLRNMLYSAGNAGTMLALVVHTRANNAPANDPGLVQVVHRLVRFEPGLGAATPFDNVAYGFIGDIVDGQAPYTVVIPDDIFNRTGVVQAPTSALLDQLLAADADAPLVGPFAAGAADTEALETRYGMFIPLMYANLLLNEAVPPRVAYQRIHGAIVNDGLVVECATLLNYLRATLVRHNGADQPPRTAIPPLVGQAYASPQEAAQHRTAILRVVRQDFPTLGDEGTIQGAQLIAARVTTLTDETRLHRLYQEERDAREANKPPSALYGTRLIKLLRWAQVISEDQLPVLQGLLASTKKSNHRLVLQDAINSWLREQGHYLQIELSTSNARQIIDLEWHTLMTNDLSKGVNLFVLGDVDEETREQQRSANLQADLVADGAAPSLTEAAVIHENKRPIYIPRTLAQLRASVLIMQALCSVFFGQGHPMTTEYGEYHQMLLKRERRLEMVEPTTFEYPRSMVPALLARRMQMEANSWLERQADSNARVPRPSFLEVFDDMDRGKVWDPPFPDQHLRLDKAEDKAVGTSGTEDTALSSLTGTAATGTTLEDLKTLLQGIVGGAKGKTGGNIGGGDQMVRSDVDVKPQFQPFKDMAVAIRKVKDRCLNKKISLPRSHHGHQMCLAWHIKGQCSSRCGARDDHKEHDAEDDATLLNWCQENYKIA
jgi:hypothetical protein